MNKNTKRKCNSQNDKRMRGYVQAIIGFLNH